MCFNQFLSYFKSHIQIIYYLKSGINIIPNKIRILFMKILKN